MKSKAGIARGGHLFCPNEIVFGQNAMTVGKFNLYGTQKKRGKTGRCGDINDESKALGFRVRCAYFGWCVLMRKNKN